MTVVNTEVRLGMPTAQLPRVNLLPPEIAQRAAARKVQVGLGSGLLGAVAVVGLLFVSASHSVSSAQQSLDTANAQHASLQKQTASFANVTQTYQAAAAAQTQLTTAMGQEVRYSQLMHDLSLVVPSTVWLKSFTYTQAPPAPPAGTTPAATAPASTAIGTVSFTGIGFDHDDLALWLEAVSSLKTYENSYFQTSTVSRMGSGPAARTIVTFSTTADLTPKAYSGRYTKPLGD